MQLDTALEIVEAARKTADELGVPMAISVVDSGKHPVAMLRMDGALPVAVDTVLAKARTAVQFGCPTGEVLEAARTNPTVYDSCGSTECSSARSPPREPTATSTSRWREPAPGCYTISS